MKEIESKTKAADAIFEIIAGALIGVDIIGILQLLGVSFLDSRLTLALYFFTVSLPLLAFFVFAVLIEKTRNCTLEAWYKFSALVLGMMGCLGGITLVIWHLSSNAGIVFVSLIGLGLVFINYHITRADQAEELEKLRLQQTVEDDECEDGLATERRSKEGSVAGGRF